MDKRPRGRQKNITGQGKDVKRRGSGLGTGPVGKPGRVPQSSNEIPSGKRSTTELSR